MKRLAVEAASMAPGSGESIKATHRSLWLGPHPESVPAMTGAAGTKHDPAALAGLIDGRQVEWSGTKNAILGRVRSRLAKRDRAPNLLVIAWRSAAWNPSAESSGRGAAADVLARPLDTPDRF